MVRPTTKLCRVCQAADSERKVALARTALHKDGCPAHQEEADRLFPIVLAEDEEEPESED
jgi:hypothetical protein